MDVLVRSRRRADNPFHAFKTLVRQWFGGQVDRRSVFSQMERDRWRLKFPPKNCRQQMLSRVLLHVVEPAFPVDLPFDKSPLGEGFGHEMPHGALFVFFHLFHGNIQRCSIQQGCTQLARIERLSAARRVEGSTVQRKLPDQLSIAARELADVGHCSGKCSEKGI